MTLLCTQAELSVRIEGPNFLAASEGLTLTVRMDDPDHGEEAATTKWTCLGPQGSCFPGLHVMDTTSETLTVPPGALQPGQYTFTVGAAVIGTGERAMLELPWSMFFLVPDSSIN